MQSSKARYQSEGSLETYMVGREIELDRIFDQYHLAVNDSRPGLVLVTGESGIGKSRLLMEFTSQMEITDSPATIISIRALTQTRKVPYYLWKAIWSIHFRLRDNASPNENRDHFLREIQKVWGFQLGPASSVEAAHLIGSLVGLPFEDSPFLREYDGEPESRMRRSYELTRELLRRMTSISPLILLLDDLQFADNGSLELILSLLEPSSDPLPLLILCGARPEFAQQHPQWLNASHIVDLGPLNVNADTVSKAYPSLAAYPEAARQEIAERSDGNPYFLEELAKSLLNSGIPPDGIAECELLEKIRALPLVSLRIMLQARLDNLSAEAKSVLMLASVVGRVFWVGAVYAAAQAGGNIVTNGLSASGEVLDRLVQNALRQLIRSELAFPLANTTFSDRQEYIFKHALLREVAYSLIPQQHKLRYHQSIGHWLTQQNQPDFNLMAADHYELGEDYEQAAHLYEMAAEQTLRQGAAREAQELIKKAKTLREPRKVIQ